jgi:hypothetical protein
MASKRKRRSGLELCKAVGCDRAANIKGYCNTHARQLRRTGSTRAIRPYRERQPDTVKFAGLRISRWAARCLVREATKRNISRSAAIALAVESWSRGR